MPALLIRNARLPVAMDAQRREIADGGVFVRDHVIDAVCPSAELPATADEVIDARPPAVIPGLVNTLHPRYRSLTRVIRPAQDCELFEWLRTLYPVWGGPLPASVDEREDAILADNQRVIKRWDDPARHAMRRVADAPAQGPAALFLCHVPRVKHGIVHGRAVVRDGHLATLDRPRLIGRHNRLAGRLARPSA